MLAYYGQMTTPCIFAEKLHHHHHRTHGKNPEENIDYPVWINHTLNVISHIRCKVSEDSAVTSAQKRGSEAYHSYLIRLHQPYGVIRNTTPLPFIPPARAVP